MNETIIWSPGMTLEQLEKTVILKALRHYKNNKTVTAHSLGIAIRTLDNKLEKYEGEQKIEAEREAQRQIERQEQLMRARGNPPNNIGIPYSPQFVSKASQTPQTSALMNDMPVKTTVEVAHPMKLTHGGHRKK